MPDFESMRREVRYGMPAADQVVFNRHYVIGYSYYFRQAKWALEIVSQGDGERTGTFRPDYRIPELFRADLKDFEKSGFDRGHLVASANQRDTEIQNSETFLLSNMSPQDPNLNRKRWKELEGAIRDLNEKKDILETFVICGPIFDFTLPVKTIGKADKNEVTLPVPHAYFKSVLTENKKGRLHMWSFILPNKNTTKSLASYQVPTAMVEKYAGIFLWECLSGKKMTRERNTVRKMWT